MVIMTCVILYIMTTVIHNFDSMFRLQHCMDILQNESGPCTGTCMMSSDDGNQFVGVKVEDVTDIKVEEDPWPATSTGIETEPAVSCMCVCACTCMCARTCMCQFLCTWNK
jgi:hypothetical protein